MTEFVETESGVRRWSFRVVRSIVAATVLACAAFAPATAHSDATVVVVDRFDRPVQNQRDGYRSTFQRLPSRAAALRVRDPRRGAGGHAMRVTANRRAAGFCGFWLHLFDMRAAQPDYFDARPYAFLSFWVRGERGGETFDVRVADANWIAKEDSVLLGRVDDFLGGGITRQWQEVIVPLDAARIDWSRLGGLTFDFTACGDWTVYLEDVAFKTAADVATPESPAPPPLARLDLRPPPRAMWLWSTSELLADRSRWAELLDFCSERHVDQIWMQLPYVTSERRDPPPTSDSAASEAPAAEAAAAEAARTAPWRVTIQRQQQLRALIALAHARRVAVHALDGAPELCLKSNHAIPLGVVEAVIRFNRRAAENERFDGVHFDNEPYLLIGWNWPPRREQILREYLELNAECQRRIRARSDMQFGVDIPFWWQAIDETTGDCHAVVEFNGVRKAASYHCIDMLDNVGVMNYRDTADGADGMIAHGRDLIAYGQRAGGATIYMGVESFAYSDRPVWFLVGVPRDQFLNAMSRHASLANQSRIDGHRIRLLDDGENIHLGIEIPAPMSDQQRAAAERSLRRLAATCKTAGEDNAAVAAERRRARAKSAIESNPEWRGFQPRNLPADGDDPAAPGFVTDSVMLPKVTFADNTLAEFDEQLSAAEDYFLDFDCYGGAAIHFYETYRALCESLRETPADR